MYRIRYAFLLLPLALLGCVAPAGNRLTQEMVENYLDLQSGWDVMSANERHDTCSQFEMSPSSDYSYVHQGFLSDVC